MQVQLLVHLPTLAKELVLSFWIMCSVLVLRIGLWTVPAMELVSTIVHTLKMLESLVWVCVYLDHATQLVLDSMLMEYDFVRIHVYTELAIIAQTIVGRENFHGQKYLQLYCCNVLIICKLNFHRCWPLGGHPCSIAVIILWIIFSRYEYNCKYSENFMSAKFPVLG